MFYEGVITAVTYSDDNKELGLRVKSIDTGKSFYLTAGITVLEQASFYKDKEDWKGTIIIFKCDDIGDGTERPSCPVFISIKEGNTL